MSTSLIATYGIPCDVVEAGARVQAFAEIKAAELTRNLCIGKKLPTEIYQVINELFEKECFERAFSEWKLDALCCSGNCLPHHHYNDEQIADIIETELDGDTDLDKLNEHLVSRDGNTSNEDYQVHGERKTRIMGKMGLNGSRAAHNQLYLAHNKCLQRKFGLQMYFTMCTKQRCVDEHLQDNIYVLQSSQLAAYLIVPHMQTSGMGFAPDEYTYGHSMVMFLNPGFFQQSVKELRLRFAKAMEILGLKLAIDREMIHRQVPTMSVATDRALSNRAIDARINALNAADWPKVVVVATVSYEQ